MILPSPSVQFHYQSKLLWHQQNYSKRSSACAVVISFAHLSDVDVYLVSFLAPNFENVVGLTVSVIKWPRTIWQLMLMMMRSIMMLKIMEMRMMISYTMNSNALLFTTNILNGN